MVAVRRYRPMLISCGLIALLLTCTNPFAPKLADENAGGSVILTDQRSFDDVLTNFIYAYSFKDSLVYSEIIDTSFTFISTNFNASPPVPINWGRDVELRTVGQMFRFFNTLDLTWNNSTGDTLPYLDDNTGLMTIDQDLSFTLTLDGGSVFPTLIGRVRYKFVQRGIKWYIARWEDLDI